MHFINRSLRALSALTENPEKGLILTYYCYRWSRFNFQLSFAHTLLGASAVELRKFSIKRYKGYAEPAEVELAPLTILVGANNAGKTALAQAIQLLAGGLTSSEKNPSEPLPLESGGIHHGETFEDLVTGRNVHGSLNLSAVLADDSSELSLSATVRNVVSPTQSSERQISKWSLMSDSHEVVVKRQGFDERAPYEVTVSGTAQDPRRDRLARTGPLAAEQSCGLGRNASQRPQSLGTRRSPFAVLA